MPGDPVPHADDLIEFLRREAPSEFARLQSIAQVAATGPVRTLPRRDTDDCSHEAWLRATFRMFDMPAAVESAA